MNATLIKSVCLLSLLFCSTSVYAGQETVTVAVQVAPGKNWTNYPTRTLAALSAATTSQMDPAVDQYGGLLYERKNDITRETRRELCAGH